MERVTQCGDRCAVGSDWRCVGHVSWPPIHSAADTYHFWLKDNATGVPVMGAQVIVCSAADLPCAMPLAMTMTNEAGFGSLMFQNRFSIGGQSQGLFGYLKTTAPTLVDYYIYWGFPLTEAQFYSYGLATTPAEEQSSLTALQVTQDADRGQLTVAVYDCGFNAAAGVQVAVDTADERTQATTVTAVKTTTTDKVGLLFFFNVPEGTAHVTATPTATGTPSGRVTIDVRKGATTVVLLAPTP